MESNSGPKRTLSFAVLTCLWNFCFVASQNSACDGNLKVQDVLHVLIFCPLGWSFCCWKLSQAVRAGSRQRGRQRSKLRNILARVRCHQESQGNSSSQNLPYARFGAPGSGRVSQHWGDLKTTWVMEGAFQFVFLVLQKLHFILKGLVAFLWLLEPKNGLVFSLRGVSRFPLTHHLSPQSTEIQRAFLIPICVAQL